jgi:hypothetical protein
MTAIIRDYLATEHIDNYKSRAANSITMSEY